MEQPKYSAIFRPLYNHLIKHTQAIAAHCYSSEADAEEMYALMVSVPPSELRDDLIQAIYSEIERCRRRAAFEPVKRRVRAP